MYRVIDKLARYKAPDRLKKQIFDILVNNIESELIQQWNKHFEALDTDNTGLVNIKELIKLIEKTGRFKSQLKDLKKLNKKDPHLKIKYSDFLMRVVDLKKEVRAEDIAFAFSHIDSDNSGKINAKDLHSFLKRRGDDITIDEAQNMIKKAGLKVWSLNFDSRDKNIVSSGEFEGGAEQGELDYPMFKTYLLAQSIESQGAMLLKKQSSIRFSEYWRTSNTFADEENDTLLEDFDHSRRFATINNIQGGKSSKEIEEFNMKIESQCIIHTK